MQIGEENLKDWSVARAIAIGPKEYTRKNVHRANCFICGELLEKGKGEQVLRSGVTHEHNGNAFVCGKHANYIRACREKYPD